MVGIVPATGDGDIMEGGPCFSGAPGSGELTLPWWDQVCGRRYEHASVRDGQERRGVEDRGKGGS